jgi:hypothetical protein
LGAPGQRTLVTALRIAEEPARHLLEACKGYKREQGCPFSQIPRTGHVAPGVHGDKPDWPIVKFSWFFTAHPPRRWLIS